MGVMIFKVVMRCFYWEIPMFAKLREQRRFKAVRSGSGFTIHLPCGSVNIVKKGYIIGIPCALSNKAKAAIFVVGHVRKVRGHSRNKLL